MAPSTSGLVTKAKYDLEKQSLERKVEVVHQKIPNTRGWLKRLTTT